MDGHVCFFARLQLAGLCKAAELPGRELYAVNGREVCRLTHVLCDRAGFIHITEGSCHLHGIVDRTGNHSLFRGFDVELHHFRARHCAGIPYPNRHVQSRVFSGIGCGGNLRDGLFEVRVAQAVAEGIEYLICPSRSVIPLIAIKQPLPDLRGNVGGGMGGPQQDFPAIGVQFPLIRLEISGPRDAELAGGVACPGENICNRLPAGLSREPCSQDRVAVRFPGRNVHGKCGGEHQDHFVPGLLCAADGLGQHGLKPLLQIEAVDFVGKQHHGFSALSGGFQGLRIIPLLL